MEKRFIVIIWHQAGGREDNKVYYTWDDDITKETLVFDSPQAAQLAWRQSGLRNVHAATIVNMAARERDWI